MKMVIKMTEVKGMKGMKKFKEMNEINTPIMPAAWVKPGLLPYLFGITTGAADKKRQRGVWLEEKHYRKAPDDTIFYNWRQIEKWWAGEI
jgi:hypothetical protein